jgi:hypothetical protein
VWAQRRRNTLKPIAAIWYNGCMTKSDKSPYLINGMRDEKTARWLSKRYELIADDMVRDAAKQKEWSNEPQRQQLLKSAVTFYEIAQQILTEF